MNMMMMMIFFPCRHTVKEVVSVFSTKSLTRHETHDGSKTRPISQTVLMVLPTEWSD